YAEPSLEDNGELRHLVAAKLDLIPRKSTNQNESILAVKRYWESKAVLGCCASGGASGWLSL
ncbi:MAG TPA: hypothetical protein VJY99_17575, partial [Buttiauxella sp.]|nr:hypothetical protein [Buttiauxella sp.]